MKESRIDPAPRNERLRLQRIQRNWRQQDVADQLGIAATTVRRWERGSQQPSSYYRVKLCTLFGVSAQELGLAEAPSPAISAESDISDTEQPDAPSPKEVALWTIPYTRNPHFTGRDDLLAHLEQQFFPIEPASSMTLRQAALTQSQAIKGLGGIGKTQIAVEYAYRARQQGRYIHTLWVNAASEETILASLSVLADFLLPTSSQDQSDQRKLVATIIRWLEQSKQPWLLIMDNADDLPLVQPYLPRRGNGHILFTTRASAVGSLAAPLEVDAMGVIEGTHLLLRRTQRFADATDEEINEASNLVVLLAQFPLALDQAGAYIEETGCSVSDYLQLYEEHRYALLARRGRQTTQHPDSVATTWSLSFQRIEESNPAAAELLRLCALLAPDQIPEELLTEGAPHWPPLLQQAVADRFAFNQMLETLLAFSLIKRLSEHRLLSIHRLVQVVQIERMKPEEQSQWTERLVRAVNTVFPRDPENEIDTWAQCQRYLEQVQSCTNLVRQHQIVVSEAAEVFERAGIYLHECALYSLAEPLFKQARDIYEQQVGSEHPLVAHVLYNLAFLYQKQSKYRQAEDLYQRAMHTQEQYLGSDHLDLAASLNNLSTLYWEQEKYEQAETLLQRAIHIQERQLGPEHILVTTSLNNLATGYIAQGKYEQAEVLLQRLLHIQERQIGPEHPQMIHGLNNLAHLYWQQQKYEQARPLFQRALSIVEQEMGPEHPNAAYPLHGLALLDGAQENYEHAEKLYQRALHIREQKLEPEHRDTAHLLYDFAALQQAQGKIQEAISMYRRSLAIREHVFGPDHPTVQQTRERLHAVLVNP